MNLSITALAREGGRLSEKVVDKPFVGGLICQFSDTWLVDSRGTSILHTLKEILAFILDLGSNVHLPTGSAERVIAS